jgi:hypothetical protein
MIYAIRGKYKFSTPQLHDDSLAKDFRVEHNMNITTLVPVLMSPEICRFLNSLEMTRGHHGVSPFAQTL